MMTVFQSPEKTKAIPTQAAHAKKKTKKHVKQSMFLNSSMQSGPARLQARMKESFSGNSDGGGPSPFLSAPSQSFQQQPGSSNTHEIPYNSY